MKKTPAADRIPRFLRQSLALVLIFSAAIFSLLGVAMARQSERTIRAVSKMYMSGISEQISAHFETAITLRLNQLDVLVETVSTPDIHTNKVQQQTLVYNARARDFTHIGFLNPDGGFTMLYGSPLTITDPEPYLKSLADGETKVAVGTDEKGNHLILLGVPAGHDPTPEYPCIALVAALPAEYISDTLSLEANSDQVYSYIIRENGTFVIRTGDAVRDSYFDRVRSLYDSVDGSRDLERYITELSGAMKNEEHYSAEFSIYGEHRQMFCTKLPYSEWFLLTFMPYSALNPIVTSASKQWTLMVFAACAVVLVMLLMVFQKYFRITAQQIKELEKARKAADRANKAKSEFLSNMSHDIRTPMNAIVGMTAIAITNIDHKEQVENCLRKIALSSKHLLGLINDVLDMSKIESGKMTLNVDQISLREVMDSIVNIVQPQVRAKRQSFNISIRDIITENVCCDGLRLNQVLINILGNAVKFTPEEGTIEVELYEELSPKGDGFIRTHVVVADNGIGMTEEYQKKIFESFSREDSVRVQKTEGTGLGMAITKYIVDAMGGTIDVKSKPGEGTTFHITLDLVRAAVQEADMVLPDWKMLLVDDDRQLGESAVASLKSIGLSPDWVQDAETAIRRIEERHGQGDGYHIILLDWKLPGMDGITAAREIRRRLGDDVPILLISAYDWGEIEDDARNAGVTGFISKPLFKSTLFYGLRPFMVTDGGAEENPVRPETAGLEGRRVLLAEDNDLNWEIANDLLSDELGLVLEWAENGQICASMFESSEPGYYEAVLMDIRMPVMNGYEATRAIRAMDRADAKTVPIIAMTADAFAEDIRKCLECGMNAHIPKPVDVRDVARQLLRFMPPREN